MPKESAFAVAALEFITILGLGRELLHPSGRGQLSAILHLSRMAEPFLAHLNCHSHAIICPSSRAGIPDCDLI